jgi:hypothetical protein
MVNLLSAALPPVVKQPMLATKSPPEFDVPTTLQ